MSLIKTPAPGAECTLMLKPDIQPMLSIVEDLRPNPSPLVLREKIQPFTCSAACTSIPPKPIIRPSAWATTKPVVDEPIQSASSDQLEANHRVVNSLDVSLSSGWAMRISDMLNLQSGFWPPAAYYRNGPKRSTKPHEITRTKASISCCSCEFVESCSTQLTKESSRVSLPICTAWVLLLALSFKQGGWIAFYCVFTYEKFFPQSPDCSCLCD